MSSRPARHDGVAGDGIGQGSLHAGVGIDPVLAVGGAGGVLIHVDGCRCRNVELIGNHRGKNAVVGIKLVVADLVDGGSVEGGDTVLHRGGDLAIEDDGSAAIDRQGYLGVVGGNDIAELVEHRHRDRRRDGIAGGGVGGLLDKGQLGAHGAARQP